VHALRELLHNTTLPVTVPVNLALYTQNMKYHDSLDRIDTPKKILKVNHAGEFGAVNIYKSQIFVCRFFMKDLVPLLSDFLADEKRHMNIFWTEIQARNGIKCKSFYLCGLGGFVMGFISTLLGRKGVMACTWAVESVVVNHLQNQLVYLNGKEDIAAYSAVESILQDEQNHRDTGRLQGGTTNFWYQPFRCCISGFTEIIIRFGMR
jgi:ubiquinone biosynthesis monooxygenase Coq7